MDKIRAGGLYVALAEIEATEGSAIPAGTVFLCVKIDRLAWLVYEPVNEDEALEARLVETGKLAKRLEAAPETLVTRKLLEARRSLGWRTGKDSGTYSCVLPVSEALDLEARLSCIGQGPDEELLYSGTVRVGSDLISLAPDGGKPAGQAIRALTPQALDRISGVLRSMFVASGHHASLGVRQRLLLICAYVVERREAESLRLYLRRRQYQGSIPGASE